MSTIKKLLTMDNKKCNPNQKRRQNLKNRHPKIINTVHTFVCMSVFIDKHMDQNAEKRRMRIITIINGKMNLTFGQEHYKPYSFYQICIIVIKQN